MIEIIPYEHQYHEQFRLLNLEWLDKYNLTESHDLMVLNDPQATILDRGGFIWLARDENQIVGTAGLMTDDEGNFELAKMAVAPAHQGRGISKILIETCIRKARELGLRQLYLYSNHQLEKAIALYERYGFKHVEIGNSPFETADVKMQIVFDAK